MNTEECPSGGPHAPHCLEGKREAAAKRLQEARMFPSAFPRTPTYPRDWSEVRKRVEANPMKQQEKPDDVPRTPSAIIGHQHAANEDFRRREERLSQIGGLTGVGTVLFFWAVLDFYLVLGIQLNMVVQELLEWPRALGGADDSLTGIADDSCPQYNPALLP